MPRFWLAVWTLLAAVTVHAEDSSSLPKAVPLTRPQMKAALDRLKLQEPRLPLPEDQDPAAPGRSRVNNGRMRQLYLPDALSGGGGRQKDPNMSFDYAFATMLFWITSRVNNCHYCLGHQENKLLSAGVTEDRIAALDADWNVFTSAERKAFAFARKLTYEPHNVAAGDLDALRDAGYSDVQILEILLLVSRYNATNRWTDALGIPQEPHRSFLTETSPRFIAAASRVAPVASDAAGQAEASPVPADRPQPASSGELKAVLVRARERAPRLPLVDEASTRKLLDDLDLQQPVARWHRLLAHFPVYGGAWIRTMHLAEHEGELPRHIRAEIAWTAALHDRAWYALAVAERRLLDLGWNTGRVRSLAAADSGLPAADQEAIRFARNLTVSPQLIVDDDIARLRDHFSDPQVAEIVFHVTLAAFFDRLTETANLPLDPPAQPQAR
ncbi:carboxymuconolactone decarboxylase family protein [Maioricimonas sp. JC845]|uniref:carboxymuconolactone decarboxylase family protein n=1 Tax=Maioricimonas sp. JC845 TaxID=3232138 RepID=UPI003457F361